MSKVASVSMRRALNDPNLLGNVLPGDSWQAWRVLLIAMMGEALTDDERPIFTKLTGGREREPLQRVEEFFGIIGRRGGKSRAIAALAVFLAVFRPPKNLAVGERPVVLCMAQNQKQAAITHGYVCGTIEDQPLLAGLVKNRTSESIELTNSVSIEIRAASFRGVRGVTALAIIADEICFWFNADDGSVNTDEAILNAVRPSLATTGGPFIAISSPYSRRGEAWETYKRHFGPKGDPLILVAQGESRALNPLLPQRVIDRAVERDPISASAEYGAQFRSDIESFINREAVEACISLGVFERAPLSGVRYCAFVDPSGGSADSMTLGIAHSEDNIPVLDCIREVKPPFSPEAVVADFVSVLRTYRVTKVHGDRYAGEWPREQFRKLGIDYEPAAKNRSEIYGELLPLINSRKCDLLDDKRMIAQLVTLERRTARGGKDSIDHSPGAHDDRINAAAGAIVLASVGRAPITISPEFLDNLRSAGRGYRAFRQ